jgi:hypothetical protein
VPRPSSADLQRREVDGLDLIAVGDQLVEDPATGERSPRLQHDDDIGIEPAHDLRYVERLSVAGAEAADPPMGVE